jgi:hypothetical protein
MLFYNIANSTSFIYGLTVGVPVLERSEAAINTGDTGIVDYSRDAATINAGYAGIVDYRRGVAAIVLCFPGRRKLARIRRGRLV